MAFNFNFDVKVQTGECCQGDAKAGKDQERCFKTVEDDTPLPLRPLKAAREHTLPTKLESLLRDVVTETVCVGSLPRLLCVNESVLERTAAEEEEEEEEEGLLRRMKTAPQRSDLLPGVYEGGLRVWECTYDLLAHLERDGGVVFSGRRVLDLGCGAGLLGVMAMRLGAEEVHFQDYNSSVIRRLTMANTALNQQEEEEEVQEEEEEQEDEEEVQEEEEERDEREDQRKKEREVQKQNRREEAEEERKRKRRGDEDEQRKRRGEEGAEGCDSPPSKRRAPPPSPPTGPAHCRFFSGDWESFLALLHPQDLAHKYDIILTSETIYNTAYYQALHEVFRCLLAHNGQVLLATKTHYFGVGGGLLLFERFVEERGVFEMRRLLDVDEGLQRHVVSLTFKRQNTHNTHVSLHKH